MKRKALSELTLLDKFLFDETMEDPEAHAAVLQIILGQEKLNLLQAGETEKEVRTAPWLRTIRLDVYAVGDDGTVYNTEMQADWRDDLARRTRYYQGLIDSSLLEPGVRSFNHLNDVCVIMIMPFDPFGEGKYCYTFRNTCVEDKELELPDGAVRIFLNTKGANDHEVSRELVDFLHYIEHVDEESAKRSGSERIQKIHTCVSRVKKSEIAGVKYMQRWEQELKFKEEGREEGRRAMLSAVCQLAEKMNFTMEQAMNTLGIGEKEQEKLFELWKSRGENNHE